MNIILYWKEYIFLQSGPSWTFQVAGGETWCESAPPLPSHNLSQLPILSGLQFSPLQRE